MAFTYRENPLFIPRYAEVSAAFREEGAFGGEVQRTLDRLEPWQEGEDPIETFNLPRQVGSRVVILAETEIPLWGVNPHHKARRPGLSPFIELEVHDERLSTEIATIELSGTITEPILTRAYPGDYMHPLPWMGSALKAIDGKRGCVDYWDHHAFVLREQRPPKELIDVPPDWYKSGA